MNVCVCVCIYMFACTCMSAGDIQKQFTKLTCVKDYMKEYQNQEKFIFRNYTVLCRHVFEGLCYLKSEGIIHRDIKCENIFSYLYSPHHYSF